MINSPNILDMRLHEGCTSLNKTRTTRSNFKPHDCQMPLPWKHQALKTMTCRQNVSKRIPDKDAIFIKKVLNGSNRYL